MITLAIVIAIAVVVVVIIFKSMWRVAEPNEALIISGLGAKGENDTSLDSLASRSSSVAGPRSSPASRRSVASAWTPAPRAWS